MKKTKKKRTSKRERKPLVISIHGENIDLDATLINGDNSFNDFAAKLAQAMRPMPDFPPPPTSALTIDLLKPVIEVMPREELEQVFQFVQEELGRRGTIPIPH